MKNKYMSFVILSGCLLGGCGIYTKYQRPQDLPLENLYRDSVGMADTLSLAAFSWKELFTDPQLVEYIELGLRQNTDLQSARLKTVQAEAALRTAKMSFLPALSLTPEGTLASYDGGKASKTYSLGAAAEWEIDIFGKLRNAQKRELAALEASRAYEQAVKTQLIATIADTYYSLLMLDKQLSITRLTVQKWDENVRAMEAMLRAGKTNTAAVSQSKANKLSAEASAVSLAEQIINLENSLSTLLGLTPQSVGRGQLEDAEFPEEMSVGIPLQLLSQRPDVRQAEQELAQAFYSTNQARSAFYPQLTLSGSAGWTNSSGMAIVNPGRWLLNAVGSIVQPIFNRGSNRANLKIAQAQQEEALLQFKQRLLDAGAEVNDALAQWQASRQRLTLMRRQINELQAAAKETQLLMRSGETDYLEVLTAQQSLLAAELSETEEQYNKIQSIINLYHALGGGVE